MSLVLNPHSPPLPCLCPASASLSEDRKYNYTDFIWLLYESSHVVQVCRAIPIKSQVKDEGWLKSTKGRDLLRWVWVSVYLERRSRRRDRRKTWKEQLKCHVPSSLNISQRAAEHSKYNSMDGSVNLTHSTQPRLQPAQRDGRFSPAKWPWRCGWQSTKHLIMTEPFSCAGNVTRVKKSQLQKALAWEITVTTRPVSLWEAGYCVSSALSTNVLPAAPTALFFIAFRTIYILIYRSCLTFCPHQYFLASVSWSTYIWLMCVFKGLFRSGGSSELRQKSIMMKPHWEKNPKYALLNDHFYTSGL